jgi:hypothetical protein
VSARTWESTPRAPLAFRPSAAAQNGDDKSNFETLQKSINEDATRASLLGKQARKMSPEERPKALHLAQRLWEGVRDPACPPETLASSLYTRDVRDRLAGNVTQLITDPMCDPTAFVTLIRIGMWVPAEDLVATNPHTLNQRLRNDLNRHGVTAASGGLIGTLDAEYDSRRRGAEFHWHLVMWGEKLAAVEKFRDLDLYKPERVGAHDEGKPDIHRVVVERRIRHLSNSVAYALKFRVLDEQTYLKPDGTVAQGRTRRIPQPHFSQWLLWMDRWRVADLLITQGLKRTAEGIRSRSSI